MTLIKSISGIRGTIGGKPGDNLTPIDVVEMTSAFGLWVIEKGYNKKVVVGRDGRISGKLISDLAISTLLSLGLDVIDLGLSTTPTVEMIVPAENAGAGIIFTASHNPKQWNALKLLNNKGEFISGEDGALILEQAESRNFNYVDVDQLGKLTQKDDAFDFHIKQILSLSYLDLKSIKSQNYKVVVDCVNSTGAISLPPLLDALGCETILINDEMTGDFAHNPEPVPENLGDLAKAVVDYKCDLGIAVDPDVDRLVFVCEDGSMFSEEYTLVAVADFILKHKKGPTVSNLSSTRALSDVAKRYDQTYHASAVGEVNVVNKMKTVGAVIGGEGNGGVILPDLHYGRDALVGIALVLNLLANENKTLSALKATYPTYEIIKTKVQLNPKMDVDNLINLVKNAYLNETLNEVDGLKIDFDNGWVHLRKSNTEPIMRIIAEAATKDEADKLIKPILSIINENYA
ncbi:MAG: phosphoglucosamine mutase [Saprospiraceae bacterium]|nr:phosphoglucosamine mutase [Saprospiraceae bacterium]